MTIHQELNEKFKECEQYIREGKKQIAFRSLVDALDLVIENKYNDIEWMVYLAMANYYKICKNFKQMRYFQEKAKASKAA